MTEDKRYLTSVELANRTMDWYEKALTDPDAFSTWPTGFKELDMLTGGIKGGWLAGIQGEAKAGKSAMLMSLFSAMAGTRRSLLLSLEMGYDDLGPRSFAIMEEGLSTIMFRDLDFQPHHQDMMLRAHGKVSALKGYYSDRVFGYEDIEALVNELQPELLFLDYWQLINVGGKVFDRTAQLERIARDLKLMAKTNEMGIFMASQLNKDGGGFRSSALEKDCDWVCSIKEMDDEFEEPIPHLRHIDVLFNRHGSVGSFLVRFNGARSLVTDTDIKLTQIDLNDESTYR